MGRGKFVVLTIMKLNYLLPRQIALRQVLRAYALYNPTVGYCQGMGMIVGLILMYMPPEVNSKVLTIV